VHLLVLCPKARHLKHLSGALVLGRTRHTVHPTGTLMIRCAAYLLILAVSICDTLMHFNSVSYIICGIYFPPFSPVSVYELFTSELESIVSNNNGCVLLSVAILNFQIFSGQMMKLDLSILSCQVWIFLVSLAFLNFFQLNKIRNTYDTILDLVFCNERNIVIKRSEVLVVPEDSYHPSLVFNVVNSPIFLISNALHYFPDFNTDFLTTVFLTLFHWLNTKSLHYELPLCCYINIEDIESGLAKLHSVKSIGPDGMPGTFLYRLRSVLCYPLLLIFNKSLGEGLLPTIWKVSSVTPVFKSGDKSNV